MCFKFQWCINKQLPPSESMVLDYMWGLSVVITDHLIIITTIKNESVQACDIRMANITGWVDHISGDENWLDNVWHFFSFWLSTLCQQLIVVFIYLFHYMCRTHVCLNRCVHMYSSECVSVWDKSNYRDDIHELTVSKHSQQNSLKVSY